MANPRKFSEKIALLAQKQAEGTAAFEAILQEVNSATREIPPPQPAPYAQKQQITPNLGTYRGGSLPNVNQMATNQGIDLQATLQHLDDMKQGRTSIDRPHPRQERHRQTVGPHRRNFPPDKRIDSSPYGSAYHLSPPPDTSWRRVHSDPSLHMNAMDNNSKNYSHPPVTPPSHRRIVEMVGETAGNNLQLNYWDSKKVPGPSRPKSCEVPNINIYPSQEQESVAQSQSIPMTANNTGSLPDLSVLQFPSPLPTPLDSEDQYSGANPGSSPVSLSPTSPHHMVMPHQSPQSPSQRRRQVPGGVSIPSPLVINQMGGPPSPALAEMDPRMRQPYLLCLQQQQQQQLQQQQQHQQQSQQQHHPHQQQQMRQRAPLNVFNQPPPVYPSQCQQHLNHHQRQTSKPSLHNSPPHHHHSPHITPSQTDSPTSRSNPILPQPPSYANTVQQQQQNHNSSVQQQQQKHHHHPSPLSPPVPQVKITDCDDFSSEVSMTQYRNNGVSDNCQSPTSPHSAPSYSPVQSPSLPPTTQVHSTLSDAYLVHQQQQQQTNALQHQFEQFNMQNPPMAANSTTMGSMALTTNGLCVSSSNNGIYSLAFSQQQSDAALQLSQAAMLGLTSADEILQPHFLGPVDVMASDNSNHYSQSSSSPTMSRHIGNQQHHHQQHQQNNSLSSSPSNSKIPDIVLTGVDDIYRSPLDFAKDIGNAIGLDYFDTDLLENEEAFKADLYPLDPEDIQMMTNASLVADPATEDTFKLDRL